MSNDYMPFLKMAVEAALEAGSRILDVYRSDDFDVRLKSDDSPLTRADQVAHNIIKGRLEAAGDPPVPILSEEGSDVPFEVRRNWSRFWLVDPLDGTKEFIKRNGEFTVNIALIEERRPVLGVVYAPDLDRLYFGVKRAGAFRCDHAMNLLTGPNRRFFVDTLISRSSALPMRRAASGGSEADSALRVVVSRSHLNEETRTHIRELEKQHGIVELVAAGSSLKLCMVAEGSADMYPRLGPTMEWDTAAAHAVVQTAGGRVVDFRGRTELVYNKHVLLNPHFLVLSAVDTVPF